MKPIRIALICNVGFEPFWYPLGISMLKENLERCTNVHVDNYYLSSEFSWYIERYHEHLTEINDEIGEDGNCYHEIYFSTKLFNHADPQTLIEKVILNECNGKDIYRTRLGETRNAQKISRSEKNFVMGVMEYCKLLDSFITRKVEETNWYKYQLIGFSCLTSQVLCSAYMTKKIRQVGCRSLIVYGGGMFREWNVVQYKRLFPFIDRFIVGDGYHAILDFIRKKTSRLKAYSTTTQNHYGDFSDVPRKVSNSDRFIFPTQLSDCCPWKKCLFCSIQSGLSRKASAKNVYEWIINASNKYGASDFGFTDSNLNGSINEFGKLCSALSRTDVELNFCGMLNPCDLTKRLCIDLKSAGFSHVLLGFENFSNSMLSKMKKRNTVLDNITALKWLVEAGIKNIVFNIIIDFPGTSKSIIEENLTNITMIKHLITRNVRCDLVEFDLERDSKIFKLKRKMNLLGLSNYEFDKICYPDKIQKDLKFHALKYKWFSLVKGWEAVESILKDKRQVRLDLVRRKGRFLIQDYRIEKTTHCLTEEEYIIYKYICENASTIDGISMETRKSKKQVKSMLKRLLSLGVVYEEKQKYLGLAFVKD